MIDDIASCTGVRTPFQFCSLLRGYSLALLIPPQFLGLSTGAETDTYSPEVVKAVLSNFSSAMARNLPNDVAKLWVQKDSMCGELQRLINSTDASQTFRDVKKTASYWCC